MKLIKILLIATILLITSIAPSAHAAELQDSIMPQEEKEKVGDVELQYNKYPISHYSMDTKIPEGDWKDFLPSGWDEAASKSWWQFLSGVNSLLWNAVSFIGMWTGQFVEFAFTLDIIDGVASEVAKGIQTISGIGENGYLSNGIFQMIILYITVAVFGWFAWYALVKKATVHAFNGLLKVGIVILLFYGYSYYAEPLLKGMNDFSSSLSQQVLALASKVTDPDNDYTREEGYANMHNAVFNTTVYQPYLLLQWGTTDADQIESEYDKEGSRIHDLLKTEDFTEARQKQVTHEVKELGNTNMQPQALIDRFGFLTLLLIANTVMAGVLFLASCAALFFQVLVIIYALIGVFALLISIFPDYSGNTLTWFAKLAHSFIMKIAFCLLLTFIFTVQTFFYQSMGEQNSYIMTMFLYLVITVGIWIKRNEILSLIVRPTRASGISASAGTNPAQYRSTLNKGKMYLNKISKPFTKPAAPIAERTGYNKMKNSPGIGSSLRNPHAHLAKGGSPKNAAVQRSTNAPTENKNGSAPAKEKATSKAKANSVVNSKATNSTVNKDVSRNQESPTITDADLNSLDKTTEKGGWGYQVNDKEHTPTTENKFKRVTNKTHESIDNYTVDRTGGQKNADEK